MDLIAPRVAAHLDDLVPERPPEMVDMEADAAATDFPIIGPAAGQFCYVVARMIGARRIFELGSGFGYSTAWFARAVRENGGGVVHHVVWDEDLSQRARRHLEVLGFADLIDYTVGEAVQALRDSEGGFDLIFNDILKKGYPDSLPVIEEKLRPGGVLVIDNMLWSGQIFDESDDSPDTEGVRLFTERITRSHLWDVTLVPIRDGLIVARRRGEGEDSAARTGRGTRRAGRVLPEPRQSGWRRSRSSGECPPARGRSIPAGRSYRLRGGASRSVAG